MSSLLVASMKNNPHAWELFLKPSPVGREDPPLDLA